MSALARSRNVPIESEAELRAWFDRDVHPFLATHAASVERLGKFGLYPVVIVIVTSAAGVILGGAGKLWPALVCLAFWILSLTLVTVRGPLYMAGGAGFRAVFKQRVVARIVAKVLPGAAYDPDLALARAVVEASGFLDDEIGCGGDDLVRGAIGRTPFAMGDVKAGITRRGSLSSTFQALLFHAEFNRSLAGRTLVLPGGESPQVLALNKGLAPVSLESPEFASSFSVYASDPVEARYVLTPSTMERLVGLVQTVGRPLYAAFDRRRVFVAIDNGKGAFEALAFGGEKAWAEVRDFAALFDSARAIVEELELNTRIWTKGFAPEAETAAAALCEPSAWSRVAAQGAWAFQSRPNLPFKVDDAPAPPAQVRIEWRPAGALFARFPAVWGARGVLLVLMLVAGLAASDLSWWAAHPELDRLGNLARTVQEWTHALALVGGSMLLSALYRMATRPRWVEAGVGGLRIGRLGPARRFAPARVLRVFAAQDLVMAQIEGSWIPVLLAPRLGGHGGARWLAAEIERALRGGER